jgi:hypothetical protein
MQSTEPSKQAEVPQAEVIQIRKLDKIETTHLTGNSG